MKRDTRLSGILHVLMHMAAHKGPVTSETLARAMQTNPVVIRRTMAGLRQHGYVTSNKGHGGGWSLACDLSTVTLGDIYEALGNPPLFAIGNRNENPDCLVEQAVNAALDDSLRQAEALLLSSLHDVTLASLSADFHRRLERRGHSSNVEKIMVADVEDAKVEDGAQHFLKSFDNPEEIAHYTDGPKRFVPGLDGLHRMAGVLLAERAPPDARVLVLGAGGGLELKALADDHPGWSFVGVDPAGAMLRLAERVASAHMSRIELVQGYIDDAPAGPFDAATCLLTLHFLGAAEREETIRKIHQRLRPGAPFVAAHGSFPQGAEERSLWLGRYAAFAIASGADPEQAGKARTAVETMVHMISPEEDEEALRNGGFGDVRLFY